jgi:hypothetical protein
MATDVLSECCTLIGVELCGGEWPGKTAAVIVFGNDVEVNVED